MASRPCLLVLASALVLAPRLGSAVQYAAPIEADGGEIPAGGTWGTAGGDCSRARPCSIADFLEDPGAERELVLLDGTYRGKASMLRFRRDLVGSPDAPFLIHAEHDGRVLIDAGTRGSGLAVQGRWIRVEGIDVRSQARPAGVGRVPKGERSRTTNVTLRRVVVYKDPIPCRFDPCVLEVDKPRYEAVTGENVHVLVVAGADHVLLEDVAAFGRGRKVIEFYKSTHVTCRRCWARQEGNWPWIASSNHKTITPVYRTHDTVLENVLATIGGSHDTRIQPADYGDRPQVISTDAQPAVDDQGRLVDDFVGPGVDHSSVGLRIRGSIVYALPGSRLSPKIGIRIGSAGAYPNKGLKDVRLLDDVVWLPAGSRGLRLSLNDCDDPTAPGRRKGCSWSYRDDREKAPLVYDQLTLRGGVGDRIGGDWAKPTNVDAAPRAERGLDIYTPGGPGASICYRTVDGVVTQEPLWPWPMQERIRAATEASLWETADIEADLGSIFAPVPSACRKPPAAPSASGSP